jgi:hypothetical protein
LRKQVIFAFSNIKKKIANFKMAGEKLALEKMKPTAVEPQRLRVRASR